MCAGYNYGPPVLGSAAAVESLAELYVLSTGYRQFSSSFSKRIKNDLLKPLLILKKNTKAQCCEAELQRG